MALPQPIVGYCEIAAHSQRVSKIEKQIVPVGFGVEYPLHDAHDIAHTLLDRLRRPDPADAWDRFVRLYAPVLMRWAQLQGLHLADAEDLAQVVLIKLIRLLPGFEHRSWVHFSRLAFHHLP